LGESRKCCSHCQHHRDICVPLQNVSISGTAESRGTAEAADFRERVAIGLRLPEQKSLFLQQKWSLSTTGICIWYRYANEIVIASIAETATLTVFYCISFNVTTYSIFNTLQSLGIHTDFSHYLSTYGSTTLCLTLAVFSVS
jgi:hypothetical protein